MNATSASVEVSADRWHGVSFNKKQMARVTACIATIALGAILYSYTQNQNLQDLQDRVTSVSTINTVQNAEIPISETASIDCECFSSNNPHKLGIDEKLNVQAIYEQVKALYSTLKETGLVKCVGPSGFVESGNESEFLVCCSKITHLCSVKINQML